MIFKMRFNKIPIFFSLVSAASLLASCDSDGLDQLDIEVPAGYELSAGTSTIFLNSSVAYDSEAPWVSGNYLTRFVRGDKLYDDVRTSANGDGGGLGPVYAGYSCGSCHRNAGRTRPGVWSDKGSGNYGFSATSPAATAPSSAIMAACSTTSPSTV